MRGRRASFVEPRLMGAVEDSGGSWRRAPNHSARAQPSSPEPGWRRARKPSRGAASSPTPARCRSTGRPIRRPRRQRTAQMASRCGPDAVPRHRSSDGVSPLRRSRVARRGGAVSRGPVRNRAPRRAAHTRRCPRPPPRRPRCGTPAACVRSGRRRPGLSARSAVRVSPSAPSWPPSYSPPSEGRLISGGRLLNHDAGFRPHEAPAHPSSRPAYDSSRRCDSA